jgi:hypothetical protein
MNCSWCNTRLFPGETCFSVSRGVITFGDSEIFVPEQETTLYFHSDCFEEFQILTNSNENPEFISFPVRPKS